jgi:hypothetical protein
MISSLVSKVNPSHLADFAALRECSVVEAAPAARNSCSILAGKCAILNRHHFMPVAKFDH